MFLLQISTLPRLWRPLMASSLYCTKQRKTFRFEGFFLIHSLKKSKNNSVSISNTDRLSLSLSLYLFAS